MTFYHLSAAPLGPAPVLRPRVPRDRMPFENRTVLRICVAPTIGGCVVAVRGCFYNRGHWWLYTCETDQAVDPIGVPDARITGERWLIEPTRMRYAGTMATAL